MRTDYTTFIFEGFDFDESSKKLLLHYSLDEKIRFTETITFHFDFSDDLDRDMLQRALFGLFVISGVSYFKASLPPQNAFKSGGLTVGQRKFFEKVYQQGLSEFFYENKLDPWNRINFPADAPPAPKPKDTSTLEGSLVAFGGGKDSILTTEILKKEGQDFSTWTVGHTELLQPLLTTVGGDHLTVERTIAPALLKLNSEGAYNGHIPISAVLAFLSVVTAVLSGKKYIVVSNERSADEGNVEYRGLTINHQYSKTTEFEKNLQRYLKNYVSPSISYFSFLRPLSELKIAQLFSQNFAKYQGLFSSCNRNFRLTRKRSSLSWCGQCPKCASVFALFAPFVEKKELMTVFGGKNLFLDDGLEATFNELLGVSGHKPFECVGEISEMRQAVLLAEKTGNYPELKRFDFPKPPLDYEDFGAHSMPSDFETTWAVSGISQYQHWW